MKFKEYFLLILGMFIGLAILYYATWYICSTCSVILYGWVFFALLSTIMIAGYGSFKIKFGEIEVNLDKAKEIKQDIDHTFASFIPLVTSMAYANDPSIKQVFNRLGGRKYIYDLMKKVLLNSTYDESTKIDLIKGFKWYLIKNLFERLKRMRIIEALTENNNLKYTPTNQEGAANKLEETINNLYGSIKNGIPKDMEYDDWLQKLEELSNTDLINAIEASSKEEYLIAIKKHNIELENLIKNDNLSENFIIHGVL